MDTTDSSQSVTRTVVNARRYFIPGTTETAFLRFEYERPPKPEGFSRANPVAFLHWQGGAVVGVVKELRKGFWVKAKYLSQPKCVEGHDVYYVVYVGSGEINTLNMDEVFYFVALPPDITSLPTEKEKVNKLLAWVNDILDREQRELRSQATEIERQRKQASPSRLPHESVEVDHHKNQQVVALNLLRKDWPRLSSAIDQAKNAKTEAEYLKFQAEASLAYIADFTAKYGKRPIVNEKEEAGLWQEDSLIRLLSDALNAPRGIVDKRDWQLANGWIEKNYYRMTEAQLEEAFNRDWNYTRKTKGSTLAKRARRLGLLSASKRGRPEIHKFADSALEIRTT